MDSSNESQEREQILGGPSQTPAENLPAPRLANGRWVKGSSGNRSGKPKGAVTVKTERMKTLMQSALADRLPEYLAALDQLRDTDPKAFAQEYRFLLEFFVPKLQRTESTNLNIDVKETQIIKIGDNSFEIR